MERNKGLPTCLVCNRLHESNKYCPLRIANAYTMQPQALERLTESDKAWMASHPNFNVLDVVEDAIVDVV